MGRRLRCAVRSRGLRLYSRASSLNVMNCPSSLLGCERIVSLVLGRDMTFNAPTWRIPFLLDLRLIHLAGAVTARRGPAEGLCVRDIS